MARDLRHLLETADIEPVRSQVWSAAPPLRYRFRVLRYGRKYLCCHCNALYSEARLAWACVTAWARNVIPTLVVESQVVGTQVRFSCPICRRAFPSIQDAQNCLTSCIGEVTALLPERVEDDTKLALGTFISRNQKDTSRRPGEALTRGARTADEEASLQPAQPATARVQPAAPDPARSEPSPILPDDLSAADMAPPPAAEPAAAEPAPGDLEEPPQEVDNTIYRPAHITKPFIREGARYRCTVCGKNYFTQVEVRACFDSHPPEPKKSA